MTETDCREAIVSFSRVARGFGEWRDRTLKTLAAQNQSTLDAEAGAMRHSWHVALADCTNDEVLEVLEALDAGQIPMPTFGEAHRAIAQAVRDNRSGRREAAKLDREHEPRYRCLNCRDTGLVEVVNPHFVEWFRRTFDGYQELGWPVHWYGLAYSAWRRQDRGPLVHSALCHCDSERVRTMKRERELFTAGNRRLKNQQLGLPACGAADYNKRVMPLVNGVAFLKQTLVEWYAEHEPNECYEWTP